MSTTKERKTQIQHFQDAVGDLVDQYLKDGLDPDSMQAVLDDEADGVVERAKEIQNKQNTE